MGEIQEILLDRQNEFTIQETGAQLVLQVKAIAVNVVCTDAHIKD